MESPNYITFPGLYKDRTYLIDDNRTYLVVIVLSDSTSVYMDDADQELLAKILKSVNISLSKAKVVNIQNLDPSISSSLPLPSDKVISFGVSFSDIGQNFSPDLYALHPHEDKVFLKADELNTIAQDKQKKILLWQALKEMFASK